MNKTWLTLIVLALATQLAACGATLPAAPETPNQEIQTLEWQDTVERNGLKATLYWVKPITPGPHATVIMHPGLGQKARELAPLMKRLAAAGYLTVAADYRREIDGEYSSTMFPWRNGDDARTVIAAVRAHPLVDAERIGVMGFSLGGAHSLMLAARSEGIRAAVVYYPMTNFNAWVAEKEKSWIWRVVFRFVRWQYNSEDEAHNDETHQALLASYSAINYTSQLRLPTLIIHGTDDDVSPIEDSQRLYRAVANQTPEPVRLYKVENEGHAFNFSSRPAAEASWQEAVNWLDQHLQSRTSVLTARTETN